MSKSAAYVCGGHFAADDVQVCAADCGPDHAEDGFIGVLDFGDGFVDYGCFAGAGVGESFHLESMLPLMMGGCYCEGQREQRNEGEDEADMMSALHMQSTCMC
jgi:hypothetical protein